MKSALQLAALVGTAIASTTTTNGGGNILPTEFPVSQFPVPTQTHFDSPSCTQGASRSIQSFTVNYNVSLFCASPDDLSVILISTVQFESVERTNPITALTPIGVYNLLNFKNINHVNTDVSLKSRASVQSLNILSPTSTAITSASLHTPTPTQLPFPSALPASP